MAKGASRILESHFGHVGGVHGKGGSKSDLVSEADKESEAYLKGEIRRRYPGHGIVGEEGTDEKPEDSDFLWVLDPLDGTLNYVNGLPIYAVSIGVLNRGVPEVGCIWTPWPAKAEGALFHAFKGGGAFMDETPITVRANSVPQPGQLAIFHRDFRLLYSKNAGASAPIGEARGPGSLAYEMALTSKGVFQYSVFTAPRIWDVAAGIALVKEAGGSVLTYDRTKKQWHEFCRFGNASGEGKGGGPRLRDWHSPIMVGSEEMVQVPGTVREARVPCGEGEGGVWGEFLGVCVVVIAATRRTVAGLYKGLRGRVGELYAIGDCLAPRTVEQATYERHKVGRGT